ncbi:MAG: hypothetical protein AAF927_14955 [Bacteroidota bacterium]
MKAPLLLLGISLSFGLLACLDRGDYDPDKYENLRLFHQHIGQIYDSLRQVYDFPRTNFDAEYVYGPEDPARLIGSLIADLTDFDAQIISSQLSKDGAWYEVKLTVNDREYQFRSEANTDWVNVGNLEQTLADITEALAPTDTFVIPFWPGDQTADVLYGKKADFGQAYQAGFPMPGPEVFWRLRQSPIEGASYYHLAVERLPSEQEVAQLLLEGLLVLDSLGFQVPQLNPAQVYVSDIFKESELIFCINGEIGNSHIKFNRKSLGFIYYGYAPIVLWRMLKNQPDTQVRAEISGGRDVFLDKEEYEALLFDLLDRQ